jgi:hypothetical protein
VHLPSVNISSISVIPILSKGVKWAIFERKLMEVLSEDCLWIVLWIVSSWMNLQVVNCPSLWEVGTWI